MPFTSLVDTPSSGTVTVRRQLSCTQAVGVALPDAMAAAYDMITWIKTRTAANRSIRFCWADAHGAFASYGEQGGLPAETVERAEFGSEPLLFLAMLA